MCVWGCVSAAFSDPKTEYDRTKTISQLSPKGLAKMDKLIVPIAEELALAYPARQRYVHALSYWAETLGGKHADGWLRW